MVGKLELSFLVPSIILRIAVMEMMQTDFIQILSTADLN